jgi:hypothetical protein
LSYKSDGAATPPPSVWWLELCDFEVSFELLQQINPVHGGCELGYLGIG